VNYQEESEFILAHWAKFITSSLEQITTVVPDSHIHPAPAFIPLYDHIISGIVETSDSEATVTLGISELSSALDLITRFSSYLSKIRDYNQFSKCPCVTLTEEELESLKQG
jgi:hypothetical protein